MAMPRLMWLDAHLSLWRLRFDPRSVYTGYMLDKVTLGQVSL